MQISNSYTFVACWSDKQGWARIIAQFRRIKACKMNVGVRARRKQQVVRGYAQSLQAGNGSRCGRAAHLSILLFIQHDATSCTLLINEQKTFRIRTLSGVVCVCVAREPNKTTALKKWSAHFLQPIAETLIFLALNSLDEWRFFYTCVIKSLRPPRDEF
jgi:hypothetical protein